MQKKKVLYISMGIFLGILTVCAYLYIFNNLNDEDFLLTNYDFTIVADSYDATGIDIDSGFIITSKEDYELSKLKEVIKVAPEIGYNLTKSGAGSYYLEPKENLESNSIFNIYVDTDENIPANSWAFQTKSTFKVISALPTDNSMVYNLESGVQISFSKKIENIEDFFIISPEVEGEFLYVGKSVTFVPNVKLANKTLYNVTIKSGLKSIDGDVLAEDYNFSFKTEEDRYSSKSIFLAEKIANFNTKNTQVIPLYYGKNDYDGVDFYVNVYNLENSENYLKLCKNEEIIDVSQYSLMTSFESNLLYPEYDYVSRAFIEYPENLPLGWYLVDIKTKQGEAETDNQHLQQLVQVSDISIYMQSMNGQSLIWCNDTESGMPLANTEIKIGENVVKTNEKGIAIFNEDKVCDVIIKSLDGKQFVSSMNFKSSWEETKYNIYLFTDREVYQPTDIVNYWGMIVPQSPEYKLPQNIDLYFDNEIVAAGVAVNSSGIFTGSIQIENRISEYVTLIVKFDDEEYYIDYIAIEEYVKPVYILDFGFDKKYYRRNEIAKIDVKGSYFDGNPANNLDLNFGLGSVTEALQLNKDGTETINFNFNNIITDYWYPRYIYAELYTSGADEDAHKGSSIYYFPTDYMIRSEVTNNELVITANAIDYSKFDSEFFDENKAKGLPQQGISGHIRFYRNDYIKKQVGTYYDYINKVTKPKYSYKTQKNLINILDFSTDESGMARIPVNYENTEDYYFSYEIDYTMPDSFRGVESGNIGRNYNMYTSQSYAFDIEDNDFKINQEIKVKIDNGDTFENYGNILYVVQNEKIQYSDITSNNEFSIKYIEEYVPDVLLMGAYFDGTNIYEINSRYLNSDLLEKELDIEITTDKETYEPRETVTVNVEAKDRNGKAAKTNMVIAVVDEAAFAIAEQEEYPLQYLYEFDCYDPITYFSYDAYTDDLAGGEGGGIGVGSYRDYFKDTVAFLTIKTGSNGKTSASFELPDNLTSWRITVIGITDNLKAGVGKTNIVTTLPFYANIVMNSKYNLDDDISFSVKSAGEYLPLLSSSIQYTATLFKDDEVVLSEKAYQLPFKSVNVNLGKVIEAGKYKLEVKAECGIYNDTIVKEIEIVNSMHEVNISREIDIQELKEIDAVKYPINLSIYDTDNKKYYDVVSKILNTSFGTTTDQKVAYNELINKLNLINENDYYKEREIKNLQAYDGGVRLLGYTASEPLLTAKVCALSPDIISLHQVIEYFEQILNYEESSPSEVSAAYFGLAALKKPVLNDIKYLLENNEGFSLQDNLNFIAGLAYIGDNAAATEWYEKLILPNIGENIELQTKYLNFEENYEIYSNTSFLAMILSKINHQDIDMVINYILKTDSNEYTPALDLIEYIKGYNPKKDAKGFIKYIHNNEEILEEFSESNILNLQLNERGVKKFSVLEEKNIAADIKYIGTIDEAINNYKNNIQTTKTISDENKVGDTRTVTITIKFPENVQIPESFIINDIIPTGMRFVGIEDFYNYKHDAQKVQFYVYNREGKREYQLEYSIRNVLEGEYKVESAIVQNPNTKEIGFTNEDIIIIE